MKKRLIYILVLLPFLAGCSLSGQFDQNVMPENEAKDKASSFINEHLIQEGQQAAEITEINEDGGLYQLIVNVGGQEIESYMTKDGKKFFATAIDMDNPEEGLGDETGQTPPVENQEQLSVPEQAQSLISQSRGFLEQQGEGLNEEAKEDLNTEVDELEALLESDESTPEQLQAKMQEVQALGQVLVEEYMNQQEQEQE